MLRTKQTDAPGLVLIVGDWVIDEYWFLVQHHSRIASHTGFKHFRLGSKPEQEIIDLCGAGHVARVLMSLRGADSDYQLIGLGVWNEADTELIAHLAHAHDNPQCPVNSPGFRVSRRFCANSPDVRLETLAPDGPTTRVIRQYHRWHGGIEQLNRVDWEAQEGASTMRKISRLALPKEGSVGKVVIAVNDLRKGVVTRELIKDLSRQYPRASWCIRSKMQRPDWLEVIKDRIALHVLGPEVTDQLSPWGAVIKHDTITYQALEILKAIPGRNVIMISSTKEIVGRVRVGGAEQCLTARSMRKYSSLSDLGFPTAVFAALTDAIYRRGEDSLDTTTVQQATAAVERFSGVPLARELENSDAEEPPTVSQKDWQVAQGEWNDARDELGLIITDGESKRLDVWRGSTVLDGYIACVKEKERILAKLLREVRAFKRTTGQPRPLSILINADPGAGKTFLAKQLAEVVGLTFLRYDITQMLHRDELVELFDSVATIQANDSGDLLVFVDEINATLDSSPVYGAFLSPLEEGYYVRKGKRVSLRPCVWLFAGTVGRVTATGHPLERVEKLSDFESRLTIVDRIDYESFPHGEKRVQDQARLEQVYLGATLIRRYFPDVTLVSEAVLKAFYSLDPASSPARPIDRMCASLIDVQYGEVSKRNCDAWKVDFGKHSSRTMVHINF